MKKLTKKFLLVILSTFTLFGLTMGIGCDCGDNGDGGGNQLPSTPMVAEISLNVTNAKMIVGDYLTITAYTNKVQGLSVEFSSENENVVTVNEFGVIEACNQGTTNVVAKYGDVTAKCAVTVNYDESVPEIIDLVAFDKDYVLYKGSSLTFQPAIKYRGRIYTDGEFEFVSTNEDVAIFDGYTLTAKDQVSVANCYVEATWRDFDVSVTESLRKDFAVKVMTEAYISLQGTSEDFIELYTRTEFEGQTFKNSNEFMPEFYADGEKIDDITFEYDVENGAILDLNNDVVTAKSFGVAKINVSCEYQGIEYVKTINVNVIRPSADYEMELDHFSSGLGTFKDVNDDYVEKTIANKIYGTDDVTIIEAYQDKKTLSVQDNKILGVSGPSNASYHTIITIGTSTEIYNVGLHVYGLYIKTAEDLGFFSLYPEYRDYYYLANDIDAYGYVLPKYGESPYANERNGLIGTFEGNGHVIKGLTVNSRGMFGGITAGIIQNVAFYDTVLSGYYPCLIAHWETGATQIKNLYAHFKDIPPKAGGLFQQRFHLSATHENIVVEYGISKEAVIERVEKYHDNSENISTFAPQRGQVWGDSLLKNCFSISYAPIGLSQPESTDYSWSSFVVAENQVIETENTETGRIDLTFKDNYKWLSEELLPLTTFQPIKKITALEGAIQVAKGIKAYNTIEEMQADKANNQTILATFDPTYWVVDNGVPYWKAIYQGMVELTVKDTTGKVVEDYTLSEVDEYLEFSLGVGTTKLDTVITAPAGLKVNGNKVSLEKALTEPIAFEIELSAVVAGESYSKVVTILATPEQIVCDEEIIYELDSKSLDFDAVNDAYDLTGDMAISMSNLDGFFVGTSAVKQDGEIELPVVIKADKSDVESTTLKLLANGKMYVLTNVKAYTKLIDEASDLDYFAHNFKETGVATEHSGYYVVTKDIDATGHVAKNHDFTSGVGYPSGDERKMGLTGVFDGRGHVISNYVAPSNGIFGAALYCVIKNVAFENVSLTKQSNYSATYPGLFAHEISGSPSGDYSVISNVYVSVKENQGNKVFVGNSIHPTTRFENVVVEYNIYGQADEDKLLNNGSISLAHNTTLPAANYPNAYKNSFVISKAPINFSAKNGAITMIHVAENQVQVTEESGAEGEDPVKVVTLADNDLKKLIDHYNYSLTIANVAYGVKSYNTIEELGADKDNNAEILATYDSKYWLVVEGIPYWKNAYYNKVQPIVTDSNGNEVSDYILDSADKTLTVNFTDGTNVVDGATITAPDGIVVNGNEIKLANAPTDKGSYEITISKEIAGNIVTRTITVQYTNEKLVEGKVLYSQGDKALDFASLNKALNAVGVEDIDSIDSYIVNGETVETLELDVIISNLTGGQGRNRSVDTAQTVVINVGDKAYLLNNVYAYTKLIDEASDLHYFTLDNTDEHNERNGYYLVTKNIDASALELNDHVFSTNAVYPSTDGYTLDVGLSGVFDGNGYTIDGLTVKSNGLFGNANAPVVKNVAFTDVNLTGYYPAMFTHTISRGKNYQGNFNSYEGLFENVYVSVKSMTKASGIYAYRQIPASTLIKNCISEYLNVDDVVSTGISEGKDFYMFGSSYFASTVSAYKDSYAISTAPVLQRAAMPGFAENQVEFTLSEDGKKIASVGKVLDSQVTEVLNRCDKTLTIEHVLVGLRAYDNYEAMKLDATANADSLATFDSNYWTIVDGEPVWNTLAN